MIHTSPTCIGQTLNVAFDYGGMTVSNEAEMITPIEALESAINEVKELGLNCETDLWTVHEELERLQARQARVKELESERDIYREVYRAAKAFKFVCDAASVPIKLGDRVASRANLYIAIQDAEEWEQDL